MDSSELRERLWESVEQTLYITKEQYLAGLEGWRIEPHVVDGIIVGAVLTKGSELHFAVFGGRWKLTRADIRRYLQPLLDAHGCVTTKTPVGCERQLRFNRLLGFEQTAVDEHFVHLKLHQLSFSRNPQCQS